MRDMRSTEVDAGGGTDASEARRTSASSAGQSRTRPGRVTAKRHGHVVPAPTATARSPSLRLPVCVALPELQLPDHSLRQAANMPVKRLFAHRSVSACRNGCSTSRAATARAVAASACSWAAASSCCASVSLLSASSIRPPLDHRSWLGRPRLAFRRPAHFDLALSLPSEHLHCR